MLFLSYCGEVVGEMQCNDSSYSLVFNISNCCYPLYHIFYQMIFLGVINVISSGTDFFGGETN